MPVADDAPPASRTDRRPSGLGRRGAAVAALLVALFVSSCTWEHSVDVLLDYDADDEMFIESFLLGVFWVDACPPMDEFVLDTDAPFLVSYRSFTAPQGEAVGTLEPGNYAFVGLALTEDCSPWVVGCQEVELEDVDISLNDIEVVVPLTESGSMDSACGNGLRCDAGRCVEAP